MITVEKLSKGLSLKVTDGLRHAVLAAVSKAVGSELSWLRPPASLIHYRRPDRDKNEPRFVLEEPCLARTKSGLTMTLHLLVTAESISWTSFRDVDQFKVQVNVQELDAPVTLTYSEYGMSVVPAITSWSISDIVSSSHISLDSGPIRPLADLLLKHDLRLVEDKTSSWKWSAAKGWTPPNLMVLTAEGEKCHSWFTVQKTSKRCEHLTARLHFDHPKMPSLDMTLSLYVATGRIR